MLRRIILSVSICLLLAAATFAQKWERQLSLKGMWKFSIGDDMEWSKPSFDDGKWESIYAPSSWEDQGFHGYDGYAWYRKHFSYQSFLKGKVLTLKMGRIDDVDEVYLNGHLVGSSGMLPPRYQTSYNTWREYPVPEKFLNANGDNIISVRVYDDQLEGGILEGDLGIYTIEDALRPDLDLSGEWKFKTGDNKKWIDPNFDDEKWNSILVPSYWEMQGYKDYDGFAWYRFRFKVDPSLATKKLVLVLGKIDDIDEVYLNGKLIGSTGNMNTRPIRYDTRSEWQIFRGYFVPGGLIDPNKENVIAVRVFDGYINGGIYQGPIGLIQQDKYTKFWREQKHEKKTFWQWMFGN